MAIWKSLRSYFAVAACAAATSSVHAGAVRFDYTGTLRPVAYFGDFSESYGYAESQAISGYFVVDTAVTDTDPSAMRAFRPLSIAEMSFGQFTTQASAANYTYFLVDADPARDNVQGYAQRQTGAYIDTFYFSIEAPSPLAVLVNDSPNWFNLGLSEFDLSDSRFTFLRVVYPVDSRLQGVQFTASFDSLTVTPLTVPEPSSLAFIIGSAVLVGVRRRRAVGPCSDPGATTLVA